VASAGPLLGVILLRVLAHAVRGMGAAYTLGITAGPTLAVVIFARGDLIGVLQRAFARRRPRRSRWHGDEGEAVAAAQPCAREAEWIHGRASSAPGQPAGLDQPTMERDKRRAYAGGLHTSATG
jgi:hypothetical protein